MLAGYRRGGVRRPTQPDLCRGRDESRRLVGAAMAVLEICLCGFEVAANGQANWVIRAEDPPRLGQSVLVQRDRLVQSAYGVEKASKVVAGGEGIHVAGAEAPLMV